MEGHRISIRRAGRLKGLLVLGLLLFGMGPARAALHADIARVLHEEGIAGAVWATSVDGRVQAGAAGQARGGVAMRADHRVQVGSIAKLMLATGVLRLVSEGRLDLDAPVADLVPGLAFDNPWGASDPVRVRHLLDHTAGLDDMRLSQFFSGRARPDMPLVEATDVGGPLQVRSRPGTRFSYSNTGYALLGRVIEQIVGRRYEAYLDEQLLIPLGLRDSTFAFTTQAGAGADARLAMGHFENGVEQPAVAIPLRPAAQFTTTARDMMAFAAFLMGDGRVDGARFIDAGLMRARGQSMGTEAARAGLRAGYALGLGLRDRDGAVGLCHGGDTVGFRAMLCVYPEQARAYFVAFNADVEGADYGRVRTRLVRAIGAARAPDDVAAAVPADLEAWAGFYVPAPNRFASFAYLDTLFGGFRLVPEGESLRLSPLQGEDVRLQPVGASLWRAPDRLIASHALLVADDGTPVIARDWQSYARMPSARLLALWASLAAGLTALAWIALAGTWRIVRRRPAREDVLRLPWSALALLAVPAALFARQPFLHMGDATAASITLALASGALPLALVAAGVVAYRRRAHRQARIDAIALVATLQWLVVLAAWGLLPIRMWQL